MQEGDDYPTILLLYKTGEIGFISDLFLLFSSRKVFGLTLLFCSVQLKLLAKSSAKEMAVFYQRRVKVEEAVC